MDNKTLDSYEETEKKIEIMFDFDNVWKSFEEQINSNIAKLLDSISDTKKEYEELNTFLKENISDTKEQLDSFLQSKQKVQDEVDSVKEIAETMNSIQEKDVTFIEADMKCLAEEVAKLLSKDTEKGLLALKEELSQKFKKTYVTSRIINQQLELANKGLENIILSCKQGNTNITTSEVLLYNLMQTIRFVDTLSDNQKEKLITFDSEKTNSNLAVLAQNTPKLEKRIDNLENNLKEFKSQTEQKLNAILDILTNTSRSN